MQFCLALERGDGVGVVALVVMGEGHWGRRLSQRALLARSKRGTQLHTEPSD